MQKEAPQNEASYFSHGLREAAFLFLAGLFVVSAIGTKRTCRSPQGMSAFGGKVDIVPTCRNVR
jgi:hypothetical protein